MKTVWRISLVVVCYLLSSYDIVLSLMLVGMSGTRSLGGALVGLLILFAWVCHLIMSIGWITDKPARKWIPLSGTLAACLGLLLWPLADSGTRHYEISDVLRAAAMGLAFTLPCVLLAVHLLRFHLNAPSNA